MKAQTSPAIYERRFPGLLKLFVTVGDAALGEVVGREFQGDAIACEYADRLAEFAGEDAAVLIKLHTKRDRWGTFQLSCQ